MGYENPPTLYAAELHGINLALEIAQEKREEEPKETRSSSTKTTNQRYAQ
jgi:hypothetical protein